MLTQRFTALHLGLVALITLLITIAIFYSPPTPALNADLDADPTTTAITNLVPKFAEVDTPPTLPVYLREEGLMPEAKSELELTLQWTVIDSETKAPIPQAVTNLQIVTLGGVKELTIEGAELEFTVPVGAVVRWKVRASGYVEQLQWREFKAKLNRDSTMTGEIRLVPLGKQA